MSKEDKGKITMTVVHFETESDNATLQENVRAIAATLARALSGNRNSVPAPKVIANGQSTQTQTIEPPHDLVDTEADAIDAEFEAVVPAKKGKASGKPKSPPQLKTLELDLVSGDVPLKRFLDRKNPQGDTKRYLCIAFWLKHYRDIGTITMHHAHTCYRQMGWSTPKNPAQPLIDLKRKNSWFNKAPDPGAYSINHLGENVVNEMGNVD